MKFIHSFRFRLAALCGGLILVLGLGVTLYIEEVASRRLTEASGERLLGVARSIATTLSDSLVERTREIELLSRSPLLTKGDWSDPDVRETVDNVKASFRPYAWLGLTDAAGAIVISGDGLLEGVNAAARPWFVAGQSDTFIGDVHEALLLANKLQRTDESEPLRFVDFAAPVRTPDGQLRGVVASHLHWSWIKAVVSRALPASDVDRGVEVFVRGRDGVVLYPFSSSGAGMIRDRQMPQDGYAVLDWAGGMHYLMASARVDAPHADALAWQVVLRQPIDSALRAVTELRQTLLLLSVPISLVVMLLAWRVAISFSRPVEALARVARAIDEGDERVSFPTPSGIRELRKLAASVKGMTMTLIRRRRELEQVNLSLEQMVASRTAELQAANAKLEALSATDALTGLANRRRLDEALEQEWSRACRAGSALGALLIDLDHFKQYNDTYGHVAGDDCLREVGRVLADTVRRAGELPARYGGEEFAVLVSDAEAGALMRMAESIRAAIEAAGLENGASPLGRITASIGVAVVQAEPGTPAMSLIERADQALYRAKSAGRNRVEMG